MVLKLSLVYSETKFRSKLVELPDNKDFNTFAIELLTKMLEMPEKLEFFILSDLKQSCYYYNIHGIRGSYPIDALKSIETSPRFLQLHKSNVETINDFREIDILENYDNLWYLLPINNEAAVIGYFKFLMQTLSINLHPDDDFADYLENGEITDFNGEKIFFDETAINFMNEQMENCFAICGDKVYEIGFDIQSSITGIGKETQAFPEFDKFSEILNTLIFYWDKLEEFWHDNNDNPANDLLCLNYPFDKSFDEIKIHNWVRNLVEKSDLGPTEHINTADLDDNLQLITQGLYDWWGNLDEYYKTNIEGNTKLDELFIYQYPFENVTGYDYFIKFSDEVSQWLAFVINHANDENYNPERTLNNFAAISIWKEADGEVKWDLVGFKDTHEEATEIALSARNSWMNAPKNQRPPHIEKVVSIEKYNELNVDDSELTDLFDDETDYLSKYLGDAVNGEMSGAEFNTLSKGPGSAIESNETIYNMFSKINSDCLRRGEQVVPLDNEHIDYYEEQLENLEYSEEDIENFIDYLSTFEPDNDANNYGTWDIDESPEDAKLQQVYEQKMGNPDELSVQQRRIENTKNPIKRATMENLTRRLEQFGCILTNKNLDSISLKYKLNPEVAIKDNGAWSINKFTEEILEFDINKKNIKMQVISMVLYITIIFNEDAKLQQVYEQKMGTKYWDYDMIKNLKYLVSENFREFEICEDSKDFIAFSTRLHGNVGDETPGDIDIENSLKLKKLIESKFKNISVITEDVDEWVYVNCTLLN